ncbi:hypothetical protein Vau01_117250 [Virgisporangium aurantiacum]|uniref:LamG-like jellyroll fold domain-containing protein n=2 Tax=Virgisporangium aurantiacum TaxID=175570 RepID=A0A8J4E7E2_9ACTN|nr:hypothetical protein Vau01_117250 [Virgisporangium aurantiacum]
MLAGGVRSRWRATGVMAVVLASLVPLVVASAESTASTASPASTAAPTELPDEIGALRVARTAGKRVEVTGLRTEAAQVYANPSGSLTAVLNAFPVRVRNGDGSWSAVDTRLRRMPDGSVGATASPLKARLSGGGSGPVLRFTRDGGELSLGWPGVLPAPVLADDTATYPEVLPGVDLKVRLTVDGFSKVLVVKSRAAATQPALRTVRFTVAAKGLGIRATPDRGLVVSDVDGATVAESGAPMMWDSAAVPVSATMPMTLTEGVLSVTPDQSLLTGPGTTYPVFVDPSLGIGNSWTMINERHSGQSYWAFDRNQHAKVGYVVEAAPEGWERYRSIFSFALAPLRGKHIKRAWMSSYLTHSYSCTDTWTDLYQVDPFSSATTWNNHAGSWHWSMAGAFNSDCGDTGRYSEWVSAAVTAAVAGGVAAGQVTFGLRAANEVDINQGWKKFDENRTTLSVEFNSSPNVADTLTVENKPCANGEGRPWVSTRTPTLRARLSDVDNDHALDGFFRYTVRRSDGTYEEPWTRAHQGGVTPGATSQITTGPLSSGTVYGFHVVVGDGELEGPATGWCEFGVDTSPPDTPPIIDTADGLYPKGDETHGGVGVSGSFRLEAAKVSDVVGYRYGLASPPVTYVAANGPGGDAIAAVTPDRRGTNKLYVQSVDRAGNPSAIAEYPFRVGSGRPPVGMWALDERSGTTLADASGNGHPATLAGGTLGRPGRIVGGATGLGVNGSTSNYATADGARVDTDKSFSVAAWVKITDTTIARTAVAQEGTNASGFYLKYSQVNNAWSFNFTAADTRGTSLTRVAATTPARVGVWTHLVGTYDAATRQATLYVDGREARTMTVAVPWNAAGPVTIGRGRWEGAPHDFWIGDIADVRLWDRRVYPAEVAELANTLTTVGDWRFEGTPGMPADSSGFNRPLTMAAGTTGTTGHRDTGLAVACNGTTGFAATAGPVVNTDQSFAVSAWVRINNLNWFQTAVSVDGSATSAFFLQYSWEENRWSMSIAPADVPVPTSARAVSTNPPQTGRWTHLVGVYDAGARQARLYVDGQLQGTVAVPSVWRGGGVLNVCRARHDNGPVDYFAGAVDDVRVLAGVPTDLDVVALYNQ